MYNIDAMNVVLIQFSLLSQLGGYLPPTLLVSFVFHLIFDFYYCIFGTPKRRFLRNFFDDSIAFFFFFNNNVRFGSIRFQTL